MPVTLTSLADLDRLPFDEVLDVRSPAEFAEDHVPGALNLPALSNEERAIVGTIYVQESRFRARRIGAAMVARNVANALDGMLADRDGGWRPLVYCWRGGQRSGSVSTILAQIGWRTDTVAGGYKAYRKLVATACHETPFPGRVMLLDGNTGTAKTDILTALARRGVQVLDLEGAANHRGSVFGARAGGQPSQKWFEGVLARAMARIDPARPVVVEAESSKVGNLIVPPTLWAAMKEAPRLRIRAPLEARAAYLTRAYADLLEDRAALLERIAALRPLHGAEVIAEWTALAEAGAYEGLAAALMARHYDPRYAKQRGDAEGEVLDTDSLTPEAVDALAARIEARLSAGEVPARG